MKAGVPIALPIWVGVDPLCEVGCPYVVRGFDYDYVGVLWLSDLVWRGRWVTQPAPAPRLDFAVPARVVSRLFDARLELELGYRGPRQESGHTGFVCSWREFTRNGGDG